MTPTSAGLPPVSPTGWPVTADLVAGTWEECAVRLGPELEDPDSREVVRPAFGSSAERVEAALAAADALHASRAWCGLPDEERARALESAAAAVDGATERIVTAEAFATGVPLAQTAGLGVILAGAFLVAAAQLRSGLLRRTVAGSGGHPVLVRRAALGPALCVVPYNAPAPMAAHKAASALAAGCPVIVKAPELAPYGTQLLVEAAARGLAEAGAPPGALQLVHGDASTGARLVADERVRVVSFTGGTEAGRRIGAVCGQALKPVQLELGGNNPLLVLPDADPEAAGRMAAQLLTTLNGQWCRALGRLIVPSALAPAVLDAAGRELSALRAGPPLAPGTGFGPLAHSRHHAALTTAVQELTSAGATAHAWTEVPARGNHFAPLLVTGAAETATRRELFGPVAAVHTYEHEEEALHLANSTGYGLEGYVCAADPEHGLRVAGRIAAGEVKVNGASVMSLHLDTPRPAWGASGLVDEGSAETLLHFTGARVTGVEATR
ncbi:aldehyde dehydrogenase family protein [Streptomyces sp. ms191]|uniref:aldehyde dehydrogenase family protein n=1 Tax=Streptomyces sp. ms191 TaxID=1827978 RepID=UPI0011CE4183|nr:aldehyde dehydrogenase family protein [Streptomyces sp. ms191]TXS12909.1 aldehyde dehydrogenase family protein [Streptomyces sp. ms191]